MPRYEYKIVPAPEKARKIRGLKGAALFAHALEEVMNELGADGWRYLRADTLPQEERTGFTSRTTTYRNLLIFQRETPDEAAEAAAVQTAEAVPATASATTSGPPESDSDRDDLDNLWTTRDDAENAEDAGAPQGPPSEGSRLQKALFLQRKR